MIWHRRYHVVVILGIEHPVFKLRDVSAIIRDWSVFITYDSKDLLLSFENLMQMLFLCQWQTFSLRRFINSCVICLKFPPLSDKAEISQNTVEYCIRKSYKFHAHISKFWKWMAIVGRNYFKPFEMEWLVLKQQIVLMAFKCKGSALVGYVLFVSHVKLFLWSKLFSWKWLHFLTKHHQHMLHKYLEAPLHPSRTKARCPNEASLGSSCSCNAMKISHTINRQTCILCTVI